MSDDDSIAINGNVDIERTPLELKPAKVHADFIIEGFRRWSEDYPHLPVFGPGEEWPEGVYVFICRDADGDETLMDISAWRHIL